MKYFLLFLFSSLFSFCNAQNIIFSDTEPDQDELAIISTTIGENKNLIIFTSNFDDDYVSIFVNDKPIYNNSISTDEILGASVGVSFDRYCDIISIKLNDKEFKVKNFKKYRFLYFYKNNNDYTIEYRKTPLIFE